MMVLELLEWFELHEVHKMQEMHEIYEMHQAFGRGVTPSPVGGQVGGPPPGVRCIREPA
jgi:hypothetical protein